MARLPWEIWELSTDAASSKIRIVRCPANITQPTASLGHNRRRPRILTVLGEETDADYQTEREAIQTLSRLAEVVFMGWHPGKAIAELKTQISQAIADERGWDVLFFAGHSNEGRTGGELSIAPNVTIALSEIAPQLKIAQARGLRFAVFNSCNGLNLAETLIELGLSQVVVMREPIHNRVAREFLVRFLRSLADYRDVHDATIDACQYLETEQKFNFPSAHLIPSLFRHPDSELFAIAPPSWKRWVQHLSPRPWEVGAVAALVLVSWQLPVRDWLLEKRTYVQAVYRNSTYQVPDAAPPILLVEIDEDSIAERGLSDPEPMSRAYLAQLIERAVDFGFPVVGVDYLLDRPHEEDAIIASTVAEAIEGNDTLFVFAGKRDSNGWLTPRADIAPPERSWQGDLRLLGHEGQYLRLLSSPEAIKADPGYLLPFGYALALASEVKSRNEFSSVARQNPLNLIEHQFYERMQWHPITIFSGSAR